MQCYRVLILTPLGCTLRTHKHCRSRKIHHAGLHQCFTIFPGKGRHCSEDINQLSIRCMLAITPRCSDHNTLYAMLLRSEDEMS